MILGKIQIPGSSMNPKSGLVALWEFEETGGSAAYATVGGNHLDFQTYGTHVYQTGKIGKCYLMDYNGYSYLAKYNGTWNLTNPTMTFNFWVKSVSNFGGLTSVFETPGWEIGVTSTAISVYMKDSNASSKTFNASFSNSNNVWMMITVVIDTSEIRVYKNAGTPQVSTTWSHTGHFNPPTTTFYLSNGSSFDDWDGYWDQTAIWNRALTVEEITYIYNSGSGRAYSTWQ